MPWLAAGATACSGAWVDDAQHLRGGAAHHRRDLARARADTCRSTRALITLPWSCGGVVAGFCPGVCAKTCAETSSINPSSAPIVRFIIAVT